MDECSTVASYGGEASNTTDAKNVAIVTFNQPVIKYDYYYWYGTQTYIQILNYYKNDPSIAGVVFKIDSGGGQVYGTPEFYDYVIEFQETKPFVVYASGYLCSGAYYMAAPANWIVVNKRADAVGSIGVYSEHLNLDGIYEKYGAKVFTIYATESTEKNKAYRELMDKGNEDLYRTTQLDPLVVTFVADMKNVRPQIKEEAFKGGVWPGTEAVAMGLADEEGTIDTAIAKVYELAESKNNNQKSKKKSMATKKSLPNIQKVLGISGDMNIVTKTLSGKKGVFIEEAQLDALEAEIQAKSAAVTTAEGKVKTAETNAENAKKEVTALDTAVNTAISTAKLTDDVAADATTATKITLLGSKVVEYGGRPGGTTTRGKSDGDRSEEADDDDNSTSIFNAFKQR